MTEQKAGGKVKGKEWYIGEAGHQHQRAEAFPSSNVLGVNCQANPPLLPPLSNPSRPDFQSDSLVVLTMRSTPEL